MDISSIKKIVKIVENSDIDEIEIEEEGKRIRVAKNRNQPNMYAVPPPSPIPPGYQSIQLDPPISPSLKTGVITEPPAITAPEVPYHEIRSPIVGTFYRAPSPDSEPYVEVGQEVHVSTVLCIVEAMKLMNEIESDINGKVVKILVENAKPVEYNQLLFLVERI
jgi:acetyl-CoA carboxylase biotin carboxyl carrier protein